MGEKGCGITRGKVRNFGASQASTSMTLTCITRSVYPHTWYAAVSPAKKLVPVAIFVYSFCVHVWINLYNNFCEFES